MIILTGGGGMIGSMIAWHLNSQMNFDDFVIVDDLLVIYEKEMIQEWLLQTIQSNRVLSLMTCTQVLVKQIKKMIRKVGIATIK